VDLFGDALQKGYTSYITYTMPIAARSSPDTLPYTSTPRVPMPMLHCPSFRQHRKCESRAEGSVCSSWYIYSADGEISEESLQDSFFGMNVLEFMGGEYSYAQRSNDIDRSCLKLQAAAQHAAIERAQLKMAIN